MLKYVENCVRIISDGTKGGRIMIKLIIFDIDGTLAPIGGPMDPQDLARIKAMEEKGVNIAICSGKTIYYQCGFARMMGLKSPILIGDVGGHVQIGYDLPPKKSYIMPYPDETKKNLEKAKRELEEKYPDAFWFEPTMVGLTPFPKNRMGFSLFRRYYLEHRDLFVGTKLYEYGDAIDVMPQEVDKGTGVRFALKLAGVKKEETASVGDGINDYAMFGETAESFGINIPDKTKAKHNVGSLKEALDIIETLI